jgi:DHA2 family multidrug resistance protein
VTASAAAPIDDAPVLGGSQIWICIATMFAAFLALLDITIVNICLPQIQATFAAELDELGWVTTAYMIANVIVMPLTGFGSARFGYRRYFAGACIVFAIGTALCASATTFQGFVVARALQGLGGGALIPLSQAILFDRFPRSKMGLAGALFGIAALAGPMIGPSLGASLLEYVEWPWLFRLGVPIALAAGALVYVHLEEPAPRGRNESFDLYGFALLTLGLASLQFVLEEGNRRDWWGSQLIVSLTITAAICLTALGVHSVRSGGLAVVDLRVFANLRFTMASTMNLMLGIAMISGSFFNALFFSSVLDYSPLAIGSVLFWANAVDFAVIPLSSLLIKRIDGRWVLGAGVVVLAWSFWLNSGLRLDAGFHQVVMPALVRSIGSSIMLVPLTIAAFTELDSRRRTGAVGLFNVLRELGASVGIAGSAHLLTSRAKDHAVATVEQLAPRDVAAFGRADVAFLFGWLEKHAAVDAYADLYLAFAAVVLVTLPCVIVLSTPRDNATAES